METSRRPTDSVRIVIFAAGSLGEFLVMTEADDRDNWKLPGGKFNHTEGRAESPDEAAGRELAEELGLTPDAVQLRAAGELVNDDGESSRYIYFGEADPGTIKGTEEVAQLGWFTEETLPETKNQGHILSAVAAARRSFEAA